MAPSADQVESWGGGFVKTQQERALLEIEVDELVDKIDQVVETALPKILGYQTTVISHHFGAEAVADCKPRLVVPGDPWRHQPFEGDILDLEGKVITVSSLLLDYDNKGEVVCAHPVLCIWERENSDDEFGINHTYLVMLGEEFRDFVPLTYTDEGGVREHKLAIPGKDIDVEVVDRLSQRSKSKSSVVVNPKPGVMSNHEATVSITKTDSPGVFFASLDKGALRKLLVTLLFTNEHYSGSHKERREFIDQLTHGLEEASKLTAEGNE